MATVSLTWKDFNLNEDGFNIYRSETPMDVNNMPAPIATVGANVGSYDDTTGVDGTSYYYRVGVVRGADEVIGQEVDIPFQDSINTHQFFGDGSEVATYNFDGDTIDLGGNYNGTYNGTPSYVAGVYDQAVSFDNNTYFSASLPSFTEITVSFWAKLPSSVANATFGRFVSVGGYDFTTGWSLYINDSTRQIEYYDNNTNFNSSVVVPTDEWFHFIISFGSTLEIYMNGESVFQQAQSLPSTTEDFYLGGNSNNSDMTGVFDQLRIIDRVVTQNEAKALYYG